MHHGAGFKAPVIPLHLLRSTKRSSSTRIRRTRHSYANRSCNDEPQICALYSVYFPLRGVMRCRTITSNNCELPEPTVACDAEEPDCSCFARRFIVPLHACPDFEVSDLVQGRVDVACRYAGGRTSSARNLRTTVIQKNLDLLITRTRTLISSQVCQRGSDAVAKPPA